MYCIAIGHVLDFLLIIPNNDNKKSNNIYYLFVFNKLKSVMISINLIV